jgi:hypothetical protein
MRRCLCRALPRPVARTTLPVMDNIFCPFARTIISTQNGCTHSTRYCVGERVSAACDSFAASADCVALAQLLRQNARFALGVTDTAGLLSFGKELKILYGGLAGLQQLVSTATVASDRVSDIHALVVDARRAYGTLQDIPYQHIVKNISAYQPARRARPPR